MTVFEYATYLLTSFPQDTEIVYRDMGCKCCAENARHYPIKAENIAKLVQPVSGYYGAPAEEHDEDGWSNNQENFIFKDGKEVFFDAPKVVL